MRLFLISAMILLCIAVVPALAAGGDPVTPGAPKPGTPKTVTNDEGKMGDIYDVLFVFLVLSVVFEVALTPLFNWRVFLARFEGKGLKTPITVILAFIVFWHYDLDIVGDLLIAMNKDVQMTIGGKVLTALLIAGGNSGIYQIFTALNINMNPRDRKKKAKEAQDALDKKIKEKEAKRQLEESQE